MTRLPNDILPDDRRSCVIRIELSATRRRQLGRMAAEAGRTADDLASKLLSDVLDDDARAHAEKKK